MTVWLLVILRFSDVAMPPAPIPFQSQAECQSAIATLRAAGNTNGYMDRALVAACIKQTHHEDKP